MKYTEKDIIGKEELMKMTGAEMQALIGKQAYGGESKEDVLSYANDDEESIVINDVRLNGYETDDDCFVCKDGFGWEYIILKKEELPQKGYSETYEERQKRWIEENNVKVGDYVKITRAFTEGEDGFDSDVNFVEEMRGLIGLTKKITGIRRDVIEVAGLRGQSPWFFWPYFCLEKVEELKFKAGDYVKRDDTVYVIDEITEEGAKIHSLDHVIVGKFNLSHFLTCYKKVTFKPFDLSKPEVRDKLRGQWIKSKSGSGSAEYCLDRFSMAEDYWTVFGLNAKNLLTNYTFLDGTPCGEEVEE